MNPQKANFFECVLDALSFVWENISFCYQKAIPLLLLVGLLRYLDFKTDFSGTYLLLGLQTVLFSIFAVAWHRITIYGEKEGASPFKYSFGMREIRFSLFSLLTAYAPAILAMIAMGILPELLVAGLILLLIVPYGLVLLFSFPAIALDQDVDFPLFLQQGIRHIGTILLGLLIVMLIMMAFQFAISLFIAPIMIPIMLSLGDGNTFDAMNSERAVEIVLLITSAFELLISPFFLGVCTSTASLFYKRVFMVETTIEQEELKQPS